MNSTIVKNFLSNLGASDFESWIIVQRAYMDHAWGTEISETGYNSSSGYLYIALENGVQLCSCKGRDVEFCVFNYHAGELFNFDDYETALKYAQEEAE